MASSEHAEARPSLSLSHGRGQNLPAKHKQGKLRDQVGDEGQARHPQEGYLLEGQLALAQSLDQLPPSSPGKGRHGPVEAEAVVDGKREGGQPEQGGTLSRRKE